MSKAVLILLLAALAAGCRPADMYDQPKFKAYEVNHFFADGRSERPLVEGTIPRGYLEADDHLYRGRVDGKLAKTYPFPITKADLERGRQRFEIYCYVCHDFTASGNGMVVRRGFAAPPNFHSDDMRKKSPGYIFSAITNGFGLMKSYADRVNPKDRWRIAAYIKTLQYAWHVPEGDLGPKDRAALEAQGK